MDDRLVVRGITGQTGLALCGESKPWSPLFPVDRPQFRAPEAVERYFAIRVRTEVSITVGHESLVNAGWGSRALGNWLRKLFHFSFGAWRGAPARTSCAHCDWGQPLENHPPIAGGSAGRFLFRGALVGGTRQARRWHAMKSANLWFRGADRLRDRATRSFAKLQEPVVR